LRDEVLGLYHTGSFVLSPGHLSKIERFVTSPK
jgi:hypothetical protein